MKKNAAMPIATPELPNEINKANATINKIIAGRTINELSAEEMKLSFSLMDKVYQIESNYDWFDRAYSEDGRCGVKDVLGNIVIPALFDNYSLLFHYHRRRSAIPMILNGKAVLVKTDGSGDVLPGTEYDSILAMESGPFYQMLRGKKFGFMLPSGKVVLDCICDKCYEPCNEVITFSVDGKWGALYNNGTIIDPNFDEIDMPELDEPLKVRLGDQWGYIDEQGRFTTDEDEAYFCVWISL